MSACGICLGVRDLSGFEVDENKSMGRDSGGAESVAMGLGLSL